MATIAPNSRSWTWVLYCKLGSIERSVIRDFSEADLLPRSDAFLLLAMRATSERRHDAFGWRSETDQEPQSKDARTVNEAAGEQLRPCD